jgi:F0F1-type ATP synthase epsilon subunit
MQVAGNHALLLVEEVYVPDALDVADLQQRLQQAQQELADAGDDTERRRNAERNQRRWEQFLRIAQS